jgi:5'-AMP-activated protein kinase, catalytic alpha subunit
VLCKVKLNLNEEFLRYLYKEQIMRAVNYCHSSGVYHLDIKPDNILMNAEGIVKLIDFGFAQHSSRFMPI